MVQTYINEHMPMLDISVYDLLIAGGPMSRDAMVQKLSRPRTTIFDSLKRLEQKGLVARRPYYCEKNERGRPTVLFYLVGRDG